MKIIFGNNKFEIEDHAKKVMKSIEKEELKFPRRVIPIGVAIHTVRYPLICDDCGETYWSRDEYGSHIKCNHKKSYTGFY
jgi:hypothetical protein